MSYSTIRKPSKPETLRSAVLSTARILQLFGWDDDVADEYAAPILKKCNEQRALQAFREIYERDGEMPRQSEVILSASSLKAAERWITVERTVIRPNGSRVYGYSMRVPHGDPAEKYVRPGETLVYDSDVRSESVVHWSKTDEGRQFRAAFDKFVKSGRQMPKECAAVKRNTA